MTIRKKQNKLDQRTKIIMIIVLIFVVILAFSYINLRQKSKKIAKEQQQVESQIIFCIDHSISAKTTFKTGYSDSGNDENRKKDLSDSIDSKCTCCTLCWNSSNGCIWDYLAFEGIIGILEM